MSYMRESKILKWVLTIGILVVLNMFFFYGMQTFYGPEPQYADFCEEEFLAKPLIEDGERKPSVAQEQAHFEKSKECRDEYQAARTSYNRDSFIILIILGLLAVVISFGKFLNEPVSLGLSLGGILAFIIGSAVYWSDMHDYLRFIILTIALLVLIYLGLKKLGDLSHKDNNNNTNDHAEEIRP